MPYALLSLTFPNNTDGQKIAKKLSIQITNETKLLQVLVREYNACITLCNHTHLQQIDMQEAKDPSVLQSKVTLTAVLHHGSLSSAKKLDIINAHLMVTRAKEEILLLKEEMFNTLMYYKNMSDCVEAAIREITEAFQNNFTRGCIALLTNKLMEIHRHIKLCAVFPLDNDSTFVENQESTTTADDDMSCSSSDSESCYETDAELED